MAFASRETGLRQALLALRLGYATDLLSLIDKRINA
jgi:hypothetical protein